MAGFTLIPDHEMVYRGMANASWCKRGVVNYKAFMLRPANDLYPIEEELSLGRSPESAVDELKENFGVGELSVQRVHGLPHALSVRPDMQNISKAYMLGVPLFSTDQTQRGIALAVATDLAGLCKPVPTTPPEITAATT
jgi:hypothetical protein